MAPKNNALMQRQIKKRDNAHDLLVFNRQCPDVAAALIDQKNAKVALRQELESKKRLLPLEIAKLSPAERNAGLYQRELSCAKLAQELPRRAIEQKYLRDEKKSGKAEAEKSRGEAVQKLDAELLQKENELKKRYPGDAPGDVPDEAVAAYKLGTAQEGEKMRALLEKQQGEKQAKIGALNAALDVQNQKLQAKFNAANEYIGAAATDTAQKLGENNIITVSKLKMYFSGIKAVDDLSFSVREGEIFGLIGPNGAGKTTVFNCITQFNKPTEGNIYYKDRFGNAVSLLEYKTPQVIKAGISRTFQNLEMVYTLTVLDNLLIGAHAFYRASLWDQFLHTGKLKREEEVFSRRATELLDRLGILAYKDMSPYGLPYGVLKKIELVRTLMSGPRMIILDEPAAGLNDAETEELTEIIRIIRDDFNCTIILVEHDMNLVMNICDTVCAISFGKLLAIGTPAEIQSSPLVQEAYLGTE